MLKWKHSRRATNSPRLQISQFHNLHWICIRTVELAGILLVHLSRRFHPIRHLCTQRRPLLNIQHSDLSEPRRSRVLISRTPQNSDNRLSKTIRVMQCQTIHSSSCLLRPQPMGQTSKITVLEACIYKINTIERPI